MRMDPVVLFQDNHCLAVAKPAPLLTQGVPAGLPTLEGWAKDYLRARYGKPGNVYLGVPHRLDRPVSGLVLFARNSKAAARLAEQFQKHQVEKVYWAIIDGAVEPAEGVWEDFVLPAAHPRRTDAIPQPPSVAPVRRVRRGRADPRVVGPVPRTGRRPIRLYAPETAVRVRRPRAEHRRQDDGNPSRQAPQGLR